MYLILVRKARMSYTVRWQVHMKDETTFVWTKEEMIQQRKRLKEAGETIKIFKVEEEN